MNQELVRARVWRLHFFTGLCLSPFFIVLALSGLVYLFKPQVEPNLYQKWLQVPVGTTQFTYDQQLKTALSAFPGSSLSYVVPPGIPGETTQFFIKDRQSRQQTVYVDPYTLHITGVQRSDWMLMQVARDIHGELLMGNKGALLMEISAGWAFILLATGLYIWWPIKGTWAKVSMSTTTPRSRWKAFHGNLGLCVSGIVFLFLMTGIPWTSVTGGWMSRGANLLGMGSPPGFGPSPFLSEASKERPMVSLDRLVQIVHERIPGTEPTITYPYDHRHAVVILWTAPHPQDTAYIHVDAYSGQVIRDYRWKDFGLIGKIIALGIATHQGTLFGPWNQALDILIALSAIAMALSGLGLAWLRKPEGAWLVIPPENSAPFPRILIFWICIFCLIVPTTGLSVLLLLALDWLRTQWILAKNKG